jgi:fumarate hydratase subunit beta
MDGIKKIQLPLTPQIVASLHAGDMVEISGTIFTARDAAHKRLMQSKAEGKSLPFDPMGSVIYYCGPSPSREGEAIGSCGPTTSIRMKSFSREMFSLGQKGIIGKGPLSADTVEAMKEFGVPYFCAIGGVGALYAAAVKASEVVAYEDLGAEAIIKVDVENFFAIVGIDAFGNQCNDGLILR